MGRRWGVVAAALVVLHGAHSALAQQAEISATPGAAAPLVQFVQQYCLDCHDAQRADERVDLESASAAPLARHPELWERVIRKLAARQMPPPDMPRPQEAAYEQALSILEEALDRAASEQPRPGRTPTFRRLNRTEYQNVIRDLLALEMDFAELLPQDEASHGFDHVTVSGLSPTLLDSYITAAQKISQRALGTNATPSGATFRLRPDLTQEQHVEGLPLGTRGGTLIAYHFPQDGEYEVQVRLARDRDEHVEGLTEPHELEILLDRTLVKRLLVAPPATEQDHARADLHLQARFTAQAGPHDLGVTFLKNSASLLETRRQPYQAHFNRHRHPRLAPAIYEVSITGPFDPRGPGETPSRRRILICTPQEANEEAACAERILTALLRRAYRRPVTEADLAKPLELFQAARQSGGFEAGIEMALSAVLVNPHFLFHIERDPPGLPPQTAYGISDVELASRLSFFLWSSIPDDELLELAERGALREPDVLENQVRRMLADERARNLVTNFAGQWLYLRNLDSTTPDLRLFPDFDDNLRQALRRETEGLVEAVLREDRSVLDLLRADFTLLNERLAKHYGIPHIYGSHFRRVELDAASVRGGLLRQGSVLTVTSYATRTSPVVRGHWILKNLMGSAPPPPPPDVPALPEKTIAAGLSVRARLAEHRASPACASCHQLMDPIGFALENFDAVGRWREREADQPLDVSAVLPDGRAFDGVRGLEAVLLERPELFVRTLTEKLLTFALGRGVEWYDAPAVRQVMREAKDENYRLSALILGIVNSTPFQMRSSE